VTAADALPPSYILANVRIGADEGLGPAAGRQVALAGFFCGELASKLPQRFGNGGLGPPQQYVLRLAKSTG
jgi:hypothetical protein